MSLPQDYIPILIQIFVALSFVVFSLIGSYLLGPKVDKNKKEEAFECGVEIKGNARFPFSVKYFMTAVLFVLFDIEIVFFYPYVLNFKEFGWSGFIAILSFVLVFFVGYFYVVKKGALDWEK